MKVHWEFDTGNWYWKGRPHCAFCGCTMDEVVITDFEMKDWMPLCEVHNNWETLDKMFHAGMPIPNVLDKFILANHENWHD